MHAHTHAQTLATLVFTKKENAAFLTYNMAPTRGRKVYTASPLHLSDLPSKHTQKLSSTIKCQWTSTIQSMQKYLWTVFEQIKAHLVLQCKLMKQVWMRPHHFVPNMIPNHVRANAYDGGAQELCEVGCGAGLCAVS